MGIVNATPDSFSDAGHFAAAEASVENGLRLFREGTAILDVGGESTRPGSESVSVQEELRRSIPVIAALHKAIGEKCVISVDTTKSEVARQAIDAGAEIVNDISGCTFDPQMIDVLCETGAGVCLMHIQGTPQTMQLNPTYPGDDPVPVVLEFLRQRIDELVARGVNRDKITVDPGLGFGKTYEHNRRLIENIAQISVLERPIIVGHSRKGFLRTMYPELDRDAATAELSRYLVSQGVQILRVHDITINQRSIQ